MEQRKKTGIVMQRKTSHALHAHEGYLETPVRLDSILNSVQQLSSFLLQAIEPRDATREELELFHTSDYVDLLESNERNDVGAQFDAVHIDKHTSHNAKQACGSAVTLVDSVVTGKVRNGFALIRPPGHHALPGASCGYSFYNNVAVSALHALKKGIRRILILDWDVHHGNGLQQAFYNDPRVLYISIHRFEHGAFWPHLPESNFHYVGSGNGKGCNVNVPLNKTGIGDADYLAVFQQIVLPLAYQFSPQMVLVACGFDACDGDPKGEMKLTPSMFGWMTYVLQAVAGGKLCLILEGGYDTQMLPYCVEHCLHALTGGFPALGPDFGAPPDDSVVESILNCIAVLSEHWPCFYGQKRQGEMKDVNWPVHQPDLQQSAHPRPAGPSTTPVSAHSAACFTSPPVFAAEEAKPLFIYDDAMMQHACLTGSGSHPERPERVRAITDEVSDLFSSLHVISACRHAMDDELLLIHDQKYIDLIASTSTMASRDLALLEQSYNSIYFSPGTHDNALRAVGGVIDAVDAVLDPEKGPRLRGGFVNVRPPGHHAESSYAYGFCFFDNVAIGAKHAIDNHGLSRVLILDWDVHHGNGIQHAFENDPRVLYVSLHRHDHGMFFPMDANSNFTDFGDGPGEGYTLNVPWSDAKMGDPEYFAAFLHIIFPIICSFKPEITLVSSGFDAAEGDYLGGYKLTPEWYAHVTHLLMSLTGSRTLLVLEGGYNLRSISLSAKACVESMLQRPLESLRLDVPKKPALQIIFKCLEHFKSKWGGVLRYQVTLSTRLSPDLKPRFAYPAPPKRAKKRGVTPKKGTKLGAGTPSPTFSTPKATPINESKITETLSAEDNFVVDEIKEILAAPIIPVELTLPTSNFNSQKTPSPGAFAANSSDESEFATPAAQLEYFDQKCDIQAPSAAENLRSTFQEQGSICHSPQKPVDFCAGTSDDAVEPESKSSAPRRVGLVYDPLMLSHENLWDKDHIEIPHRLSGSYQELTKQGLTSLCVTLTPRDATEEELLTGHSKQHVEATKQTMHMNEDELMDHSAGLEDVYFCKNSYPCAMRSAGCTLEAMDAVLEDRVDTAFALVRPPGHHASYDEPCGFCIFNNVALAALKARKMKGPDFRILIVDLDVHHGNGTQYMTEKDPNILFFSIHRYERGKFWPNLPDSNYDHFGPRSEDGLESDFVNNRKCQGTTVNFPLNCTAVTDVDYFAIFHHLLLPLAAEFDPDLVLVSAGFDCLFGDPQGEMQISPMGYATLMHSLLPLCSGKRLLCVFEGGYFLPSVYRGVAEVTKVMIGLPHRPTDSLASSTALKRPITDVLQTLARVLSPYWQCMEDLVKFMDQNPERFPPVDLKSLTYNGELEWVKGTTPYPQQDVYPPRHQSVLDSFTVELEAMMAKDQKRNPKLGTLLFDEAKVMKIEARTQLDRVYSLPVGNDEPTASVVSKHVIHDDYENAFISVPESSLTSFQHQLQSSMESKRLLAVQIRSVMRDSSTATIEFSMTLNGHGASTSTKPLLISMRPDCSLTDWLWILHQVVMPLSFSVNPDLIMVTVRPSGLPDTTISGLMPYLLFRLKGLAYGRLIVLYATPTASPQDATNLLAMLNCLAGHRVPALPHDHPVTPVSQDVRDQTVKLLATHDPLGVTGGYFGPPEEASKTGADSGQALELLMGIGDFPVMYAVAPQPSCPHLTDAAVLSAVPPGVKFDGPCSVCGNLDENWICMTCGEVNCSRFKKAHGVDHYTSQGHSIALSYADLSCWCYACECYLDNPRILPWKSRAHFTKFGQAL